MKRTIVSIFALVLLFAAQYSYGQMGDMEKQMKNHMGGMMGATENKGAGKKTDFTREAEAAGVTVKVTYKNPEEKIPVFNVALETHSVDLDPYKFDEIVVLRDDTGKIYNATFVSSSGSGHHREAILEFKDAEISETKFLELVVKGVAGVDERVFKFEVQKEMMK